MSLSYSWYWKQFEPTYDDKIADAVNDFGVENYARRFHISNMLDDGYDEDENDLTDEHRAELEEELKELEDWLEDVARDNNVEYWDLLEGLSDEWERQNRRSRKAAKIC